MGKYWVAVNYYVDCCDGFSGYEWAFWGPYETAEEMLQASKNEVLSGTKSHISEMRFFKSVDFNEV